MQQNIYEEANRCERCIFEAARFSFIFVFLINFQCSSAVIFAIRSYGIEYVYVDILIGPFISFQHQWYIIFMCMHYMRRLPTSHTHTHALSDGKNIRHLTLIQLAAIYVSQLNSLEFLSYGRRRVCWWICTRACKFNWISAPNGKATHTAHNYIFG